MSRCRDRSAVLREEEEEEQEEVTGSLLRGGEDVTSSPEDEEGDEGEVETCPPLLSVPPVSPRLQSTLHCINLSIQQVNSQSRTNYCSISPATVTENLNTNTICSGDTGRGLRQCRQRENLPDLCHLRTGEDTFASIPASSSSVLLYCLWWKEY